MKIGYARISTKDQNIELQTEALKKAGCEKIYSEVITGAKEERPQLQRALDDLRKGDVLVVWKLDRLGRSLKHLVSLGNSLIEKGVGLLSLCDNIDTTTAQGRLNFNIFASLAEFERELIRERTKAGLEIARARGRMGGRREGLSKKAQTKAALVEILYKEGKLSLNEICKEVGISRATVYTYLRYRNVPIGAYVTPTYIADKMKKTFATS